MDNEQQAAILALIVTALKVVRQARQQGAETPLVTALESEAINALESLPEVSH